MLHPFLTLWVGRLRDRERSIREALLADEADYGAIDAELKSDDQFSRRPQLFEPPRAQRWSEAPATQKSDPLSDSSDLSARVRDIANKYHLLDKRPAPPPPSSSRGAARSKASAQQVPIAELTDKIAQSRFVEFFHSPPHPSEPHHIAVSPDPSSDVASGSGRWCFVGRKGEGAANDRSCEFASAPSSSFFRSFSEELNDRGDHLYFPARWWCDRPSLPEREKTAEAEGRKVVNEGGVHVMDGAKSSDAPTAPAPAPAPPAENAASSDVSIRSLAEHTMGYDRRRLDALLDSFRRRRQEIEHRLGVAGAASAAVGVGVALSPPLSAPPASFHRSPLSPSRTAAAFATAPSGSAYPSFKPSQPLPSASDLGFRPVNKHPPATVVSPAQLQPSATRALAPSSSTALAGATAASGGPVGALSSAPFAPRSALVPSPRLPRPSPAVHSLLSSASAVSAPAPVGASVAAAAPLGTDTNRQLLAVLHQLVSHLPAQPQSQLQRPSQLHSSSLLPTSLPGSAAAASISTHSTVSPSSPTPAAAPLAQLLPLLSVAPTTGSALQATALPGAVDSSHLLGRVASPPLPLLPQLQPLPSRQVVAQPPQPSHLPPRQPSPPAQPQAQPLLMALLQQSQGRTAPPPQPQLRVQPKPQSQAQARDVLQTTLQRLSAPPALDAQASSTSSVSAAVASQTGNVSVAFPLSVPRAPSMADGDQTTLACSPSFVSHMLDATEIFPVIMTDLAAQRTHSPSHASHTSHASRASHPAGTATPVPPRSDSDASHLLLQHLQRERNESTQLAEQLQQPPLLEKIHQLQVSQQPMGAAAPAVRTAQPQPQLELQTASLLQQLLQLQQQQHQTPLAEPLASPEAVAPLLQHYLQELQATQQPSSMLQPLQSLPAAEQSALPVVVDALADTRRQEQLQLAQLLTQMVSSQQWQHPPQHSAEDESEAEHGVGAEACHALEAESSELPEYSTDPLTLDEQLAAVTRHILGARAFPDPTTSAVATPSVASRTLGGLGDEMQSMFSVAGVAGPPLNSAQASALEQIMLQMGQEQEQHTAVDLTAADLLQQPHDEHDAEDEISGSSDFQVDGEWQSSMHEHAS